jgi:uncharacterized membrane protein HdeD (DUF308 family)
MNEIDMLVRIPQDVIQHWGWFLALGIALVLLGFAAIVRSVTATVVSMLFFGWLLVIGGGMEIVQAFMVGKWAGFFVHLLVGVIYLVTGLLMVRRPILSAEVLTLFMAMFFLVTGVFQLAASLWIHVPGWGWQALDGAITTLLGILVLTQWPLSGLWVIGLFVGIELIIRGAAWIELALELRSMS